MPSNRTCKPTTRLTALLEKIALNRKLSPHWTVSLGLSGEQESILQEEVTRHYNLIGIPRPA